MNKHRLQFDFTSTAVEGLDAIKDRIHAANRAEVVRRSLRLYDWVTEQLENGNHIGLEKDGKIIYFKDI